MVQLGLATDNMDARNKCFDAFKGTPEFSKLSDDLTKFLIKTITYFPEKGG